MYSCKRTLFEKEKSEKSGKKKVQEKVNQLFLTKLLRQATGSLFLWP